MRIPRVARVQLILSCLVVAGAVLAPPVVAGELVADESTLLLLHCNGTLDGAGGETPTQATGVSFVPGVHGQGAWLQPGNQVYFAVAGNLDPTVGTLELWVRPQWPGNDGENHWALRASGGGGILVGKDGGNYWRSIFNRYAEGGQPEVGAGFNVSAWPAGEWRHAAFTWSSDSLKVYVDGSLVADSPVGITLPALVEDVFQLGGDGTGGYLDAVVDELRVSSVERTASEIAASYAAGLPGDSLSIDPATAQLLRTWWWRPDLSLSSGGSSSPLPPALAVWSSSDETVATVSAEGLVVAVGPGQATVTASYAGMEATATVTVTLPLRAPEIRTVPAFLATPASGARHEIPVVILRYLPTSDGVSVDPAVADWSGSLADLEERIATFDLRVKYGLEEGSRFRGYAHPSAPPSLGYRVVKIVTVYEPLPKSEFEIPWNPGWFRPDYEQILTRWGAEELVDTQGVKEFWLWGYHHAGIEPVESNMSSPTTGDVSNSERRNDDLPVYGHTYTLYNYNFTRSQAEALHDHGHQLEAILSWASQRQDGNTDLFWKSFVGRDDSGAHTTGRCGWTHMPPNTTEHYDYLNATLVESDCMDWTPDRSGDTEWVNVDTWGEIDYAWPGGAEEFEGRREAQFLVWWWQNMPGRGNGIAHGDSVMTDWWDFTGSWDAAVEGGLGLYGPGALPPRGDMGGDGRSDVLWRHRDGGLRLWHMNGSTVEVASDLPPRSRAWVIEGVGDFDADGRNDVLWRHRLTGTTELWLMDGAEVKASGPTTGALDRGWRVEAVADLDGDRRADVLWRHRDGTLRAWSMDRMSVAASSDLPAAPAHASVVGVQDFDADGRADLLWRTRSGWVVLWLMQGTSVKQEAALAAPVPWCWTIVALGDLNGDDRTDIVWRHAWGGLHLWQMKGTTVESSLWLPPVSRGWEVAGLGDFDGDGRDDLLWRARWSGATAVWLMNGNALKESAPTTAQADRSSTVESPEPLALHRDYPSLLSRLAAAASTPLR